MLDLTNTYFEGQASANTKAKRGRSKEKRSDCKLQTLALVVDELGFAKYSQFYPDNQTESKTLKQIIESAVQLRPCLARDRTAIIDAGIATEESSCRKMSSDHKIRQHAGITKSEKYYDVVGLGEI